MLERMQSAILGGLYGLAIGDALGGVVEYWTKEEIEAKYGVLRSYQTMPDRKAGEGSDDTRLALEVGWGIMQNSERPVNAIGQRFLQWYKKGPKGIGQITECVLTLYAETNHWELAAQKAQEQLGRPSLGNGALMRTLVISYAYYQNKERMYERARQVTRMTHNDPRAEWASQFYNGMVRELILQDPKTAYVNTWQDLADKPGQLDIPREYEDLKMLSPIPRGTVIDSLLTSLHALATTQDAAAALYKAVNLGGDSDTIGALTGGLAGTYYGKQAWPLELVSNLQLKIEVERVAAGMTAYAMVPWP